MTRHKKTGLLARLAQAEAKRDAAEISPLTEERAPRGGLALHEIVRRARLEHATAKQRAREERKPRAATREINLDREAERERRAAERHNRLHAPELERLRSFREQRELSRRLERERRARLERERLAPGRDERGKLARGREAWVARAERIMGKKPGSLAYDTERHRFVDREEGKRKP